MKVLLVLLLLCSGCVRREGPIPDMPRIDGTGWRAMDVEAVEREME